MPTLALFPEGGLASSVITTVWVGVFVLCFFNLRYGWVLSGLVVPGYLVPLLIVKPIAAAVIVVEAIMAYAIVWLFSEKLSNGRFPSLFGRDRFMGLILSSIVVRIAMDGWVLPALAAKLSAQYDLALDWRSDLQSFGLVIISLLANQFWKPGLSRGLFTAGVTVGLTFLIVRFGLMEFTNFRMSGVSYLYEGIASSILASPKAYMILVLTALYASYMNVKYGWDFSGILIPALIALQWYQPTKIITSFVEAAAIYFIARQLLKTRLLSSVTMEGANKILLFFNISFALKLLVGHLLVILAWNVKTTDFYGFGYLLSTLLAMKAHDKDIFPRLMRSTLQVSFVGAVLGNLAGVVLAAILPSTAANAATATGRSGANRGQDLLVAALGDSIWRKATFADGALREESAEALTRGLLLMENGLPPLKSGTGVAAEGWRLSPLDDDLIAMTRDDGDGADLILFDSKAPNDLALIVDGSNDVGIGTSAIELRKRLGARWLILTSPQPPQASKNRTVLSIFRSVRTGPELMLKGAPKGAQPRLLLADRNAPAIDISSIRRILPDLSVGFASSRQARDPVAGTPGRLELSPSAAAQFAIADTEREKPVPCDTLTQPPSNPAVDTLLARLFLRQYVLQPLLQDEPDGATAFALARESAELAGYKLLRCFHRGRRLTALVGPEGTGRYYFADTGRSDRIVLSADTNNTPIERKKDHSTTTLAAAGFSIAGAANAKLYAIAPNELNYDGSQRTVFGTVVQTALDSLEDRPAGIFQLRSRPFGLAWMQDRTVVTLDRVGDTESWADEAIAVARKAGLSPIPAMRDRQSAGFEAFAQTTLVYLNHSANKRYAVLFVPGTGSN
ncbi:hypothetical protein E3U23_09410 [Erythrobacter litoralis]|uniref:poly-gamma-glutamate biosynthesis protein PgsC/CapC n=1 Tax=Erythrobacter litoralis TaxID=39960 RepID=UPI00243481EB|nr:poly-gamma-glutamate biosynthesis protein PgsC/CapC [Erythrobacter litoralis]MDG6079408.1 hypothetical protein [Erythrobacter litoralis]